MPITTAAENDIEVADGLERSVCVYVRSIQDERVRATRCFTALSPSPPPPPPAPQSRLASIAAAALKRRVRHGGTNGAEGTLDVDSLEQYTKEAEAKQKEQLAYLEQLSDSNFQLREVLGGIIDRVEGRRLWQRTEFHQSHRLDDNILATTAFGNAPVAGVTLEECQVLCAAIDNATVGTCQAVAYARLNADPRCFLLKPTAPFLYCLQTNHLLVFLLCAQGLHPAPMLPAQAHRWLLLRVVRGRAVRTP